MDGRVDPYRPRLRTWVHEAALADRMTRSMMRARTPLLISFALVCGAYGAAPPADDRAERAVAEIEKVGGTVGYDESRPDTPVNFVSFYKSRVVDSVLSHLRSLPEVREIHELLGLYGTQVTDAGLPHVMKIKNLRRLYLGRTRITDEGLIRLSGKRDLEVLSISDTQISGAGLARLSQLSNLKELTLERTQVTDNGLGQVRDLKNLEFVRLFGTQVTLEGVKELRRSLPWTEVRLEQ